MYIFCVLGAKLACVVAVSLLAQVQGAPNAGATTTARLDELWKRRDQPGVQAEQKTLLDQALPRAPRDYGLLWRGARYYFWLSDDPDTPTAEKMRLGKIGWDLAERAVAVNPNDVAGHFWAVGTMGNYALGLGVMRAIAQRIEGKFKDRISRAEALDPGYAHGGIPLAWGRYWAKLPWPKYSEKKARAQYARALQINPHNLRARVFLADLLVEEDEPEEARRLLEEVLRAPVGRYDAPEEKRAKLLAGRKLQKLRKE